jgi:hypothetical protein|tara:strand:+ start:59 stop:676 length:618 start_codon:yes stop_codon:yes gene_type:complete
MIGICNKNNRGLTLLEALISTLIVGIGFVAIFQMVQYSINSIDVSSDRNKGNYLVNMVAEDMLANKNTGRVINGTFNKFTDILLSEGEFGNEQWSVRECVTELNQEVHDNTFDNKVQTWDTYFSHGITKCRPNLDVKILRIIDICDDTISVDKTWTCRHTNNLTYSYREFNEDQTVRIYDERYFGKMEMNFNKGQKTRSLYFQIK